MGRGRIVVIGTCHMDFTAYMDRFPKPGETVLGKSFATTPGGKGANQAIAAARLGATCHLVSKVGIDFMGERLIENLMKNGIITNYVKNDQRSHSGVAVIYVNADGENMIASAPGVDHLISETDVMKAKKVISSSDVLLVQLEIPVNTTECAIRLASEMGKRTILNPAPASEVHEAILQHVDFLTPNEIELARLTNMKIKDDGSIVGAAKDLIERGAGCVVVTLGKRGAMLVTGAGHELIPSYDVQVVDTVGAGDAFNGAFAVGISLGCDPREAARFATLTASLKVTKRGAQDGLPTLSEVSSFAYARGVRDLPDIIFKDSRA